jgi:hypothetical protein
MTDITQDEFTDEYDGCETPPERTTFSDADAQATSWFSYKNAVVGDSSKWEWYAPDGTLYGTSSGTYPNTSGCWMSRMGINGRPAASKLGQWQVKVYRNGQHLFTDTFTIQKDTTAPSGSVSINSGASKTNSIAVTLTLSATDNIGVTGYYVSQNSTTPSSSASGWTSVSTTTSYAGSVSYTLSSGDGSKTVYAWFKDSSGNVSSYASDDITLDTTTPTITPVASPTLPPLPTPQVSPSPAPTLPPFPTPLVSPSPAQEGIVFGFVNDEDEESLEGVSVTIKRILLAVSHGNISVQAASLKQQEVKAGHDGVNVKANGDSPSQQTVTDEDGYYEFSGLAKGSYTLTYEKDGYQTKTKSITLEEGEEKDIGTTVLEEEGELGKIYGYAVDIKGDPIESVRLKLKGLKTGVKSIETSDGDGFFEFADLGADTYILTAQKKRYRKARQTITLEEGESKEIEIEMRKTSKRIKDLLPGEDGQ